MMPEILDAMMNMAIRMERSAGERPLTASQAPLIGSERGFSKGHREEEREYKRHAPSQMMVKVKIA